MIKEFCNRFDDEGDTYLLVYNISKKGYCFVTVFVNDKKVQFKRISEAEYINAYDCHINA